MSLMQIGENGGKGVAIFVDDQAVELMLANLEMALSPVRMADFLDTSASAYFHRRMSQRFASEGDDVSGAWAPLRPRTVEDRLALGYGAEHPIQRRTGDLENFVFDKPGTVTQEAESTAWEWPGQTGANTLDDIKYAVAQTGRKVAQKKRPIVGLNAKDAAEVLFELENHIFDALATGGAGGPLTFLFGGA